MTIPPTSLCGLNAPCDDQNGTEGDDIIRSVKIADDGSIYLGGESSNNFTVIEIDPDGNCKRQWTVRPRLLSSLYRRLFRDYP